MHYCWLHPAEAGTEAQGICKACLRLHKQEAAGPDLKFGFFPWNPSRQRPRDGQGSWREGTGVAGLTLVSPCQALRHRGAGGGLSDGPVSLWQLPLPPPPAAGPISWVSQARACPLLSQSPLCLSCLPRLSWIFRPSLVRAAAAYEASVLGRQALTLPHMPSF